MFKQKYFNEKHFMSHPKVYFIAMLITILIAQDFRTQVHDICNNIMALVFDIAYMVIALTMYYTILRSFEIETVEKVKRFYNITD